MFQRKATFPEDFFSGSVRVVVSDENRGYMEVLWCIMKVISNKTLEQLGLCEKDVSINISKQLQTGHCTSDDDVDVTYTRHNHQTPIDNVIRIRTRESVLKNTELKSMDTLEKEGRDADVNVDLRKAFEIVRSRKICTVASR